MGRNFGEYLSENNVDAAMIEMSLELMVDKCIKEGKSKDGALDYAKDQNYPSQVSDILKKLPRSIFEAMIDADITYESLMEEYDGDVNQMIDDYLTEDEDEDDEDDKKGKDSSKSDEDDDKDSEDDKKKKKMKDEQCDGKGKKEQKRKGKKELDETDDSDDLGTKADYTATGLKKK